MNDKVWFIQVNGNKEGPFTAQQLRHDQRITPDTRVWKQGFTQWIAIRYVPELKEIFADEEPLEEIGPKKINANLARHGKDELAIDLRKSPPLYFWLIVVLVILAYLIYRIS
jgi:hypothetical protein